MNFDVNKLTPLPFEHKSLGLVKQPGEERGMRAAGDPWPMVANFFGHYDNADFFVKARNAFDIQMQMEWGVTCHQDDGWYAIDGSGDRVYIIVGRKNSYPIHEWSPAHHNNPVEAILKTWEWYQANKHREVT